MSVSIILGLSSLEITSDPSGSNSSELIPKSNISGVFPVKFQQRQVNDTDWTYPFNTITKIRIYTIDGNTVDLELQNVSNQSTWNNGTLSGQKQSVVDINNWIQNSNPIPSPPYAIFSADGIHALNLLTTPYYQEGSGPSADSILFSLLGSGLLPSADDITLTPDSDFTTSFDFYNPETLAWEDSVTIFSYTGGSENLSGFKVRLKAGLNHNSYSGALTLTAPNTTPFILICNGNVSPATYIVASGGIETIDNDFKEHAFYGDDVFDVTQLGVAPFDQVEYLVLPGGGGGGAGNGNTGGGGGGGGGYKTGFLSVIVQSYPITIGAGGSKGTGANSGTKGSDSVFSSIISEGGGFGATQASNTGPGGNGGSGGGSSFGGAIGLATAGQGNNGGQGVTAGVSGGGGGGGAGAVGSDGTGLHGGNGGNGLQSSISGSATYYGGGGGGGALSLPFGNGGLGGGGNGSVGVIASNGSVNTGGGGGGAGNPTVQVSGGNGGSGVVIIRYKFQ